MAAIVAGAAGLMEYSQSWQLQSAQSAAAAAVAHVLAAQIGDDTPLNGADMQQVCRSAVRTSCVLGVWVLNDRDEVQTSAVRHSDVDSVHQVALPTGEFCRLVELPESIGRTAGKAHLVDLTLPRRSPSSRTTTQAAATAAHLRVLVQLASGPIPWTGRVWMWMGPLLILGAVSSAVGLRRLHFEVVAPISELGRVAAEESGDRVATASVRNDEIGTLARVLMTLRHDRDEWRARAEQTARTVDAHVAQRTQSIRGELRRAQLEIWTDPLTRLNNRRVLQDRFGAIFDSQRDAGQDLSVVMLDIDNFKPLNDGLGHLTGDELLKFCAELLRGSLRSNDLAVRYGGDEFTLILPSVSAADATSIAQRIVALFGQRARLLPNLANPPSLSAGVASLWEHKPATADELLQMADKALYEAKSGGRNDVRAYAPPAPAPARPRAAAPVALRR